MDLLIKGLKWQQAQEKLEGDIRIYKGIISEMDYNLAPKKNESVLEFNNHFVYPGLINAHDHLEMNLYPKMPFSKEERVNPPYGNYTEWGHAIYKPNESPIREIEGVSIEDRLLWGGIKNLISGATTVVHHNPWRRLLSSRKFPVKVLKKFSWSHSLSFGKNISKAFPKKKNVPYIINAAEGTDQLAFNEIGTLNTLGILKSNTVLIHAIALSKEDITLITKSGASIVWCPSSNFFLFNKTAPIEELNRSIRIALGTDSTLTGPATLFEEMRVAKKVGVFSHEEIYHQVTEIPAKIFDLPPPRLTIGSLADFIVLPKQFNDYHENLVQATSSQIELVVVNGQPHMCSETIASRLQLKKYFAAIDGIQKWFLLDIKNVKKSIEKKAGAFVQQNVLWKMIN